jgi:hypothetical protein
MVVLGHLTFSFENLNKYTWLIISVSCEGLLLFGWDGGVTWDKGSHNLTSCFNSLREWSNIKQEQILDVFASFSRKDGSLDGGTESDSFVWVD